MTRKKIIDFLVFLVIFNNKKLSISEKFELLLLLVEINWETYFSFCSAINLTIGISIKENYTVIN